MINTTKILHTTTNDPYINLAIEEYLLDTVGENECILYLWQNKQTVVVGKNQNPWRECATETLEKDGGRLVRRLSGGGTVYHDMGNLNFTFLMSRQNYNLDRQFNVILYAVKRLGIDACMTGRNDLTIDGYKFSGNAFCFRKNSAYHHGTILVSEDMSKLGKYLTVSTDKLKAKGIQSVKSRVTNLKEYKSDLTVNEMVNTLKLAFKEEYGGSGEEIKLDDLNIGTIEKHVQKYSSWEWTFGSTPDFDIDISNRFTWGNVEFGLKLENAKVVSARVFSDAMDADFIEMLPSKIESIPFGYANLAEALSKVEVTEVRKQMLQDISEWLLSKI